jgi:hypothetical protein
MPEYTVSDGTNIYPLTELEISYTGTELDEAQFTITGVYALDTAITIYSDTTAQFVGYVKDVEEIEQGALFKYTAYEKAVELKTMPYLSSSLDIFTKSAITVANLATDILTSAPDSNWDLAAGMVDATSVTMNFYLVNRLQALNKVLREMQGYYVLFDSTAKTVKFLNATGINTDRSATDMQYVTKTLVSSSMLRGITQIVVIGKDSSIRGTYGSSTSSRAYYQVDDITTNAEALSIATAIYNDIGVNYSTYKVTVSPDQIQYDVRDKVKVDGSYYWVKSLIQSMDEIEMILDSGKISVIESFGSRIHLIEGNFPAGSDQQWSGGVSNVAANSAAYTDFSFDIKDVAMVSGAMLDCVIGSFVKAADVSTSSGYLSDVSFVNSTSSAAAVASYGSNPYYYPDGSYLTCTGMTNGYQFGSATIFADFFGIGSANRQVTLQFYYSTDTTNWYTLGEEFKTTLQYDGASNHIVPVMHTIFFDGSTSSAAIYIRCNITSSGGSNTIGVYSYSRITVRRFPRHLHSVSTTYDKTTTGTPPTKLYAYVNGTYKGELTPGTPIAINTNLITGKNVIRFQTAASAGNQCSVNPTITYQTLGKS